MILKCTKKLYAVFGTPSLLPLYCSTLSSFLKRYTYPPQKLINPVGHNISDAPTYSTAYNSNGNLCQYKTTALFKVIRYKYFSRPPRSAQSISKSGKWMTA